MACASASGVAFPIQNLVRALQGGQRLGREPTALEAFAVEPMRRGRLARRHDERRDILEHHTGNAGHHVCANLAELMHASKSAQNHPVADFGMSGQRGIVGKNRVVAHHAIVRDVDVGHDPVMRADGGHAAILHRADIEGAELANDVVVTDLQPGRLARIFLVLRRLAERNKMENPVVRAYRGVARDHGMCADRGAGADLDVFANDGVGANLDIIGQPGARGDQRSGMDRRHVRACRAGSP